MKCDYIDHMGDDLRVVNAARVSFDKESNWEKGDWIEDKVWSSDQYRLNEKDIKLINYLASHNHWTPFSHCTITLRETVPIFVARQRFKHVVGFTYNEVSRRYVDDDPEFYIPTGWRKKPEGSIKQGSSDELVDLSKHLAFENGNWETYFNDYRLDEFEAEIRERSLLLYKALIRANVAPEQARMVLPQSMYTSYYVTGSLPAFSRAYSLRSDPHAQQEIQELASMWNDIINPLFPVSWSALTERHI